MPTLAAPARSTAVFTDGHFLDGCPFLDDFQHVDMAVPVDSCGFVIAVWEEQSLASSPGCKSELGLPGARSGLESRGGAEGGWRGVGRSGRVGGCPGGLGWMRLHSAEEENGGARGERDFPKFLKLSQWKADVGTWPSGLPTQCSFPSAKLLQRL